MDELKTDYHSLVAHYERCFLKHGATPHGVDWPNAQDMCLRFEMMLGICQTFAINKPINLLDVGCGYGGLLDFIQANPKQLWIHYHGIDLSEKMIAAAKERHPQHPFEQRDLITDPLPENSYDYIIMNGVFTEKLALSQNEMERFFSQMLACVFKLCRVGMAFNVMSAQVDWFRDDLFHLSFDRMAQIIKQHCSRHFTIRADYGLYEYTVYVYKQPRI